MRAHPAILIALLGIGLVACGESGNPLAAPTPEEDTEGPVLLVSPSFEEDIQAMLVRAGCTASTCHGDGSGQGDLFLDDDTPWENWNELVNQVSTNEPEFVLVKPFEPDESLLILRLEFRNSALFPEENGNPITPVDLANLRTWIKQGARF